jgi:hypothetical protein
MLNLIVARNLRIQVPLVIMKSSLNLFSLSYTLQPVNHSLFFNGKAQLFIFASEKKIKQTFSIKALCFFVFFSFGPKWIHNKLKQNFPCNMENIKRKKFSAVHML